MTIQATLREALSLRIPDVDFSQYFSFIESCPLKDKKDSEHHHILPQKEFPEFTKTQENLVYLSSEDHLCIGGNYAN